MLKLRGGQHFPHFFNHRPDWEGAISDQFAGQPKQIPWAETTLHTTSTKLKIKVLTP